MDVLSRFNAVFGCQEYLHRNGRSWTLHLDLAARFHQGAGYTALRLADPNQTARVSLLALEGSLLSR
jgi:hypothetical protein